jgi:hypothetical protein
VALADNDGFMEVSRSGNSVGRVGLLDGPARELPPNRVAETDGRWAAAARFGRGLFGLFVVSAILQQRSYSGPGRFISVFFFEHCRRWE